MTGMVQRLANACALGWRQQSFVNELALGPVRRNFDHWGVSYGDSKLAHNSWKGLRSRLVAAGFVVIDDEDRIGIYFPEGSEV